MIISVNDFCINIIEKNQSARNGQNGICELKVVLNQFLNFDNITINIEIILQIIYVKNRDSILKVYHNSNHINIAILKSHPHIQAHPDSAICMNKKLNIINTQIHEFINILSVIFKLK